MRNLGIKGIVAIVAIVCSLGFIAQAGAVVLDETSPEFMGSAAPPGTNESSEADIINFLAGMAVSTTDTDDGITYVRSSNPLCFPTCPEATTTGSSKDESGDNTVDVTGFTYLIAKYDGPHGASLIWYVEDLDGEFDIPSDLTSDALEDLCGDGKGCGLSHFTLYNPGTSVPEPGTLVLLGGALVGLGIWRRKR